MVRRFSESHMENVLLRDSHVISITHGKLRDVPSVDYLLFSADERDLAEENIMTLGQYVNSPYIRDNFRDHGDRQNWRDRMCKKYTWFHDYYNTNAYKSNSLLAVSLALDKISSAYIGKNRRKLRELLKREEDMRSEPYDDFTLTQKRTYIRRVKQVVYDVLVFLSSQSPASSPH